MNINLKELIEDILFLLFLTFISRGEIETILDLLKFLTKFI